MRKWQELFHAKFQYIWYVWYVGYVWYVWYIGFQIDYQNLFI